MLPLPPPIVRGNYLGPDAVAASKDGKTLYITLADARQLALFDVAGGKVVRTIALPAEPTGLALSPDGTRLYVTCAAVKSTVAVIDTAAGKIVDSIPVGHTAHGLAVTPDGKRLYVCNRFNNDVSVITIADRQAGGAGGRDPRALCGRDHVRRQDGLRGQSAAAGPGRQRRCGGQRDCNRHGQLPGNVHPAAQRQFQRPRHLRFARRAVTSTSAHPLALQLPATQLDRGWMNTNAMSIIDAAGRKLLNTVLLDDVDLGAANPWGVTTTDDGKTIFVTHAGTHELSRIDAVGACWTSWRILAAGAAAADVPAELSFSGHVAAADRPAGQRAARRWPLSAIEVFVAEYFTDTLAMVDLRRRAHRTWRDRLGAARPAPTPGVAARCSFTMPRSAFSTGKAARPATPTPGPTA